MDVAICTNNTCPLRKDCFRFNATPGQHPVYRRFEFVDASGVYTCEHFVQMQRIQEGVSSVPAAHFKNPILAEKLAQLRSEKNLLPAAPPVERHQPAESVVPKKIKRRRLPYRQARERMQLIRDMLARNASNAEILRKTKEECGVPANYETLHSIRNGTYIGPHADVLEGLGEKATPDKPQPDAKSKEQDARLRHAARALLSIMQADNYTSVTVKDTGEVDCVLRATRKMTID